MALNDTSAETPAEASSGETRGSSSSVLSRVVPHVAALALLAAFLAVFFARFTIQQRVLSASDLIYTDYPWAANPPAGYTGPSNPYQSDDVNLGYPRRWALYNGSGSSWWQDDYLAGSRSTFAIDFLGQQYYPPAWVFNVLPFDLAVSLFPMLTLLAAGISMYLLLWQYRLAWLPCLYGALLFTLNGHFIAWLAAPSLPAQLGLVPLMIFGFERYHERRQRLYLLIPALCLAMQIYLAYIPSWAVSGIILCLYGAVRTGPLLLARRFKAVVAQVASYLGAVVLGLLLSAYSLAETIRSASESGYQTGRTAGLSHYPLDAAWTFLFPSFFGNVYKWFAPSGNFLEWVAYAGITTAPLALLGLLQLRRSWLAWFAVILLVFSAGQVYGIPPVKELAHLPVMRQINPGRWLFGLDLASCLLAPLGLQLLVNGELSRRTRRLLALAAAGLLLLALAAVGVLWAERHDTASWRFLMEGQHLIPRPWQIRGIWSTYSSQVHRQILFLIAAVGLVIAALLVKPPLSRLAAFALIALAFCDIFAFGFRFDGSVAKSDLYPSTPALAFLQQDEGLFRIAPVAADGGRLVMPGYLPALYGLHTIAGYDHFRNPDYEAFLAPILSENDRVIFAEHGYVTIATNRQPLNRNILSLLNVKYVLASPSGLFDYTGGQKEQDRPFPIYGAVRQGELLSIQSPRPDAMEILLATGGRQGPQSTVIIHLKRRPADTKDISTISLRGRSVLDNSWHTVVLPDRSILPDGPLYLEVEAPQATPDHPLYLWGTEKSSPGLRRFESGKPVTGNLVFHLLRNPASWLKEVYSGDDATVYQVQGSLPRVWGVGTAEVVASKAEAMARVASADFDPANRAVFAGESGAGPAIANQGTFAVHTTQYRPDSMTIGTQFSAPGYLVTSTRFDGGWEAYVDGTRTAVLRADGILEAIAVPAGDHVVTMEFRPPEYVWGERISLASVLLTLLAAILYVIGRRLPLRTLHGWRSGEASANHASSDSTNS